MNELDITFSVHMDMEGFCEMADAQKAKTAGRRRLPFLPAVKGLTVRTWFACHGTDTTDQVCLRTFFWDAGLRNLTADYTIHLNEYGFEEIAGGQRLINPWYTLTGRMVRGKRGLYFCVDSGEESYFPGEVPDLNGILFIPQAVADAHPGLAEAVEEKIRQFDGCKYMSAAQVWESNPGLPAWMKSTEMKQI